MKTLITGGAGFIGQHLAHRLSDCHELTALDILHPQVHLDPDASQAAFPGKVTVGDISHPSMWDTLARPDIVVHLAAETGTAQSMYETERYRRVNVEGTRLVAQRAAAWGAPLVFLSSRAVYGEGRYRNLDGSISFGAPTHPQAVPEPSQEDDEHRPVSFYGQTKSEGEDIVSGFSDQIGVGIIRPQNVVGPGQALHNPYTGVFAAWLARMREELPLLVYGTGEATRDIVHVSDVAAMIEWLANELLGRGPGAPIVVNCGTGQRSSLLDMARYAIAGSPTGTGSIEHVDIHRAGDIQHACADLSHARSLGAPVPQWTTAEAVKNFISWSWDKPGASSQAWDSALTELKEQGFTS